VIKNTLNLVLAFIPCFWLRTAWANETPPAPLDKKEVFAYKDNSDWGKGRTYEDAASNCNENGNALQLSFCALSRFIKANSEMKNLYFEMIEQLNSNESKERLRDAQEAWTIFRDKSCLYEAGPEPTITAGWANQQFSCLALRTEQRILELKTYIDCTQNGCPD